MQSEISSIRITELPWLEERFDVLRDSPLALTPVPETLWVRGDAQLLTEPPLPFLLVTGARAATGYGVHTTAQLIDGVTPHIVMNGGGYGIDAAAIRAALARDLKVLIVQSGGLEHLYPRGNERLFERVIESGGAIVSAAEPAQRPTKFQFLNTSMVQAAIADRTVIVEAGSNSGSLYTARVAQSIGASVGAVPGPVTSASSFGANQLIRDGATLITSGAQINALPEYRTFLAPTQEVSNAAVMAELSEAWNRASALGLVGGTYYDHKDVRNAAEEWELGDVDEQTATRALRIFHRYEVQDGETLADALREAIDRADDPALIGPIAQPPMPELVEFPAPATPLLPQLPPPAAHTVSM